MNFRQKVAVAVADVAIIAELCISIYIANRNPEEFNSIFFKYFLAMIIPTLIIARVVVKRLHTKEPESTT